MGSLRADADFPPGQAHQLGLPLGCSARCVHTSQTTAQAGRHSHWHAASACPADITVYVCLVPWQVSYCTVAFITPSILAHLLLEKEVEMSSPTFARPGQLWALSGLLASITASGPDRGDCGCRYTCRERVELWPICNGPYLWFCMFSSWNTNCMYLKLLPIIYQSIP